MNRFEIQEREDDSDVSTEMSKQSSEDACEVDSVASDRSYNSKTSLNELSDISESDIYSDEKESSVSLQLTEKSESQYDSEESSDFGINNLTSPIYEDPEIRLHQSQGLARSLIKNKKFDAAITEYIKCLALARIVYGEDHWCLAQAHMILAESYLELKNYVRQALDHAEKAKKIILLWTQLPRKLNRRRKFLYVLVNVYLIIGRTQTVLRRFIVAEKHLEKAFKLSFIYIKNIDNKRKGNVLKSKIVTAKAKFLFDQQMFAEAIEEYKKILNFIEESNEKGSSEISVRQNLGRSYQKLNDYTESEAQYKSAIDLSEKLLGNFNEVTIESKLLLAQNNTLINTISAQKEAENILKTIIDNMSSADTNYSNLEFQATDLLFSVLISLNKEEEAKELLECVLPKKCEIYGQASNEVIVTLRLLGSLCLTLFEPEAAAKYLKKCYDRELILYGSNNCRVKNTKHALELVCQNNAIPARYHVSSPLLIIENRPRFILS